MEYVFTDKTGTLTENEMQFRECSIAGVKYVVSYVPLLRACYYSLACKERFSGHSCIQMRIMGQYNKIIH